MTTEIMPTVIVHGGAGPWPEAQRAAALEGCREAARAGAMALDGDASAMDAVIIAVRALEADARFNAGRGAVLTRDRTIELDASVMDGADLSFGAVACMPDIMHPVEVARAVLRDRTHALLCGDGAWVFAREHGFSPCDAATLITERALERWHVAARAAAQVPDNGANNSDNNNNSAPDPGTVGACAVDRHGHVAAATSTGGTSYKRVGRIGDTPLCGAGTYADDRTCAASATGHGEAIMRMGLTLRCSMYMAAGMRVWDAAWRSVRELERDLGADAGIICVDARGRVAAAHNTPGMPFAVAVSRPSGIAVHADITSREQQPDIEPRA